MLHLQLHAQGFTELRNVLLTSQLRGEMSILLRKETSDIDKPQLPGLLIERFIRFTHDSPSPFSAD
jgi:hypothetical protein